MPFITSDSSASELERRDDTARDNAASTDVLDTDAAELGPSGISADELATTLDVLARMAETDPGRTLFGYVRAVVRQWLRDMARAAGITIDVTTAELNDLVAQASRYMRRGDGVAQGADHVVLTKHVIERLRAVFAGEDLIIHRGKGSRWRRVGKGEMAKTSTDFQSAPEHGQSRAREGNGREWKGLCRGGLEVRARFAVTAAPPGAARSGGGRWRDRSSSPSGCGWSPRPCR